MDAKEREALTLGAVEQARAEFVRTVELMTAGLSKGEDPPGDRDVAAAIQELEALYLDYREKAHVLANRVQGVLCDMGPRRKLDDLIDRASRRAEAEAAEAGEA